MKLLLLGLCFSVCAFMLFAPHTASAARSLSMGSEGSDVTVLQEKLIEQSYLAPGNAIGYFGPLTESAVREFQCATNVVCGGTAANGYGVYGPATQAMMAWATDYDVTDASRLGQKPLTPKATGEFEFSGWIPYWRSVTGTEATLPHLSKLSSVMPFGYTMKNAGTLADTAELTEEPWTSFIREAKRKDVYVVPSVMWGSGETTHAVLRDTDKRVALENEIAQTVRRNNFDGIDIDFEAKRHETIVYFSAFLKGLYEKMGNKWVYCAIESRMPLEHRYLQSVLVPPDATDRANDYQVINKYCDQVEIMAYDQGRVDQKLNLMREEPYAPVADPLWVESLVKLVAQDIERDKIILGVPTYGYGYRVTPRGNGTYDYQRLWAFNPQWALDVATNLGIKPGRTSAGEMGFTYDEEKLEDFDEKRDKPPRRARHDAWDAMSEREPFIYVTWSDAEAIAEKVELAKELGLRGVAVFKFDGGEDPEMWDELR